MFSRRMFILCLALVLLFPVPTRADFKTFIPLYFWYYRQPVSLDVLEASFGTCPRPEPPPEGGCYYNVRVLIHNSSSYTVRPTVCILFRWWGGSESVLSFGPEWTQNTLSPSEQALLDVTCFRYGCGTMVRAWAEGVPIP
jgi:hypothetical protein